MDTSTLRTEIERKLAQARRLMQLGPFDPVSDRNLKQHIETLEAELMTLDHTQRQAEQP